ncbi:hypothetical protein [Epilithonimonas sp.]|uniref:hypothetical protein n=1 Tax=Epilithonimonas sp. TaxID=2894511 RepID=UPI0035AEE8B9
MKNIFTFFFIILSILEYSQNWKLISTEDDKAIYYKPNTYDTAWIKTASEKTEYYLKNSKIAKITKGYILTPFKFDCVDKKMGLLQMNVYSKAGKLLNHFEEKEIPVDMNYVIPETLGEKIFLCFL